MTKVKDEQQEHLENDLLSFINVTFIAPIRINGNKPTIGQYEEITSIGRTTIGYYGLNSASDFGLMMPLITVQFVPFRLGMVS